MINVTFILTNSYLGWSLIINWCF